MASVRIQYYALLREQAGRGDEQVDATGDAATLYDALATRHGFTLPRAQLKVAVNGEFAEWSRPLADGDEVVFIPPVAGG